MSKTLIIGIVIMLLIGGSVLFTLKKLGTVSSTPSTQYDYQQPPTQTPPTSRIPPNKNNQKSPAAKPTSNLQRNKPIGTSQILGAQMGTNLAASGAVLKAGTVFSPTTPTIYAVLSLKNAMQRTQLSYARYYEGKYVDSKVSHPSKDGVKYFHFDWVLKAGKTRKVGNYSLVFYVDGKKVQTVPYSIQVRVR